MRRIDRLSARNLAGQKVLVRVDFNVPFAGGRILDDFRIEKTLPLIKWLARYRARVILISHLERNGVAPSFGALYGDIGKRLPGLKFARAVIGKKVETAVKELKNGEVLLLDNLRRHPGEERNDAVFAKSLALLADLYVNEAFGASHRQHASIVGIPKYLPAYAGLLFREEISHLREAFYPARPFLFIVGGNKISTKIALLDKFLLKADAVFIGGAMANAVFRGAGYNIGRSYFEKGNERIIKKLSRSSKTLLPKDVAVFRNGQIKNVSPQAVRSGDTICDIGRESVTELARIISSAKFVLWNGPLGYMEKGYKKGTRDLAKALAASKARVIIGGGDTVAAVEQFGLLDKFYFVSTGGGAMLDFLAKGTLPGIKALK